MQDLEVVCTALWMVVGALHSALAGLGVPEKAITTWDQPPESCPSLAPDVQLVDNVLRHDSHSAGLHAAAADPFQGSSASPRSRTPPPSPACTRPTSSASARFGSGYESPVVSQGYVRRLRRREKERPYLHHLLEKPQAQAASGLIEQCVERICGIAVSRKPCIEHAATLSRPHLEFISHTLLLLYSPRDLKANPLLQLFVTAPRPRRSIVALFLQEVRQEYVALVERRRQNPCQEDSVHECWGGWWQFECFLVKCRSSNDEDAVDLHSLRTCALSAELRQSCREIRAQTG